MCIHPALSEEGSRESVDEYHHFSNRVGTRATNVESETKLNIFALSSPKEALPSARSKTLREPRMQVRERVVNQATDGEGGGENPATRTLNHKP